MPELLKDQLFNAETVGLVADDFARGVPGFVPARVEKEWQDGINQSGQMEGHERQDE